MIPRRQAALPVLALVVVGIASSWSYWKGPSQWKPDSLFYEAQVLEVRGKPAEAARREVFAGPLAAPRRAREAGLPENERKVSNPEWVRYSAQFYRRRWVVPVLAAAVFPLFGTRSVLVVSLVGYLACGPLLYALLRRRYPRVESALLAAAFLLLLPLRFWSSLPLTDSLGLALLIAALTSALLVLERGLRWLPLWGLTVAALAFTRDAAVLAVAAVVWVALRERSRRTLLLATAGIAAALPAPLAFGAPLKRALAYTVNNFFVPPSTSWHFIGEKYGAAARSLIHNDFNYVLDHPISGLVLVVGVALLFLPRQHGGSYFSLLRAATLASLVYLFVLPNYTAFRLELVFVPMAAAGLAALVATGRRVDRSTQTDAGRNPAS